jgi:glycosyltransferase involved in cell wall biosynthesis
VKKRVCFFSRTTRAQLQREQYSVLDLRILGELGYEVVIATSLREVPMDCDLYYAWWAAGSVLPLLKSVAARRPIVVVAGGNDSMLYRDSVTGQGHGYLGSAWYKRLASRLSLRFGTLVLVASRFMVDDAIRLGARDPVVVHNAVDTDLFRSGQAPREFVSTIFNLERDVVAIKRGEVFLRSVPLIEQQCPGQRYVVIGRAGNEVERLQKLVRDLNVADRVTFTGAIDNRKVVDWMQRSRVYVQPSDTETFGLSIAEAMSCETPVVVSRRGAIPEVVSDAGRYVDHNDARSVASGVVEVLMKTEADRAALGRAARERIVTHFSYEHRRAALEGLLKRFA